MDLKKQVLVLQELERRNCERSFFEFCKVAVNVLEPETVFEWNWHIEFLCKLLQNRIERVVKKEPKLKDLLINVPPRSMKSYIVTRLLNAWTWIHAPWCKFLTSSYGMDLSTDHTMDTRKLISSEWYQRNWGHLFKFAGDQNVKSKFHNDKGGRRRALSIGSSGTTGFGGDVLVVDDPTDPEQAGSDTIRETANRYFNKTLYNRLNDAKTGLRIVVMQRLHEDDMTGMILKKYGDKFTHVNIPARLNSSVSPPILKSFYKDGLFWPERYSNDFLNTMLSVMGEYGVAAQYQQSPSPEAGGLLKTDRLCYIDEKDVPNDLKIVRGWDLASSIKQRTGHDPDYTVGVKIGLRRLPTAVPGMFAYQIFILDVERFRLEGTARNSRIVQVVKKDGDHVRQFIEAFGAYKDAYTQIRDALRGVRVVSRLNLSGDKVVKATPLSIPLENSMVVLVKAPWNDELIHEMNLFPNGKHDDQVDALAVAYGGAKKGFISI
jgi:predicted phage terminase large subunit-like protein